MRSRSLVGIMHDAKQASEALARELGLPLFRPGVDLPPNLMFLLRYSPQGEFKQMMSTRNLFLTPPVRS